MRFISDQEGIMKRYLREKDNWTSHLDNTKQFILHAFEESNPKTVAILGSGWLLDLPIEKVAERFKKVVLVDVYHPAQIRKKMEKFKNVSLFETDLSGGGIKYCWKLRKRKEEHLSKYILDDFKPEDPELPHNVDAYISLNLLNQLDILLVDFLKRSNERVVEAEIRRFRKKIQQFHLDWITKKPGCLITDVEEISTDDEQKTTTDKLVFAKFPSAIRSEEWTWDFDLSKQYRKGVETRMKVKAIEWK